MFKTKTYESVAEMVRDGGGDPAFADDFEKHVQERRLVKRLIALRCARGLSQKDIAEKMGCTQGRISKLEASRDDDIRFGDIRNYARALGLSTFLGMEGGTKAVARVKYHANCIKQEVESLARLAMEDEVLAKGVSQFFGEAAFNLLNILEGATKKLPPEVQPFGVSVVIVGPEGEDCEVEAQEPPPPKPGRPKSKRKSPTTIG